MSIPPIFLIPALAHFILRDQIVRQQENQVLQIIFVNIIIIYTMHTLIMHFIAKKYQMVTIKIFIGEIHFRNGFYLGSYANCGTRQTYCK